MKISDRTIQLLIRENFNKNDVVYISTENWNIMFDGNRSLQRFPSDDYMKKLKPFFVNKILGKVVDVYTNGTIDVKFNQFTFGLKNEFVTKLAKGQKIPSPEKVVEENVLNKKRYFKIGDKVKCIAPADNWKEFIGHTGTVIGLRSVNSNFVNVEYDGVVPFRRWWTEKTSLVKLSKSKHVRQLQFEEVTKEKNKLSDFKIGDRVIGVNPGTRYFNLKGIVKKISKEYVYVLFDNNFNHGMVWGALPDNIKKIPVSKYVRQLNFNESYKVEESLDKLADQVNIIVKKLQKEGKVKPEEIADRVQQALKLELTRSEIISRYLRTNTGQYDSEF